MKNVGVEVVDRADEFVFSELPEEEKQVVVNEIYERWKDVVYMNAKKCIRKIFEESVSVPSTLTTGDEINLGVHLHLVVGDIVQVLGRYRRKKGQCFARRIGCDRCGWKLHPGAIIPYGPGPMDRAQLRCPGCGEIIEATEVIEVAVNV